MAQIFARANYDDKELEHRDSERLNYSNYMLNIDAHENVTNCYPKKDLRNSHTQISRPIKNNKLDLQNKVNVESLLQNRHVELNSSKKLNKDYQKVKLDSRPTCNLKEHEEFSKLKNKNTGTLTFSPSDTLDDTRFTHPVQNYREMNTLKYKFTPFLPINPQNVLVENNSWFNLSRAGVSTRYGEKLSTVSRTQQPASFEPQLPKRFNIDNIKRPGNNEINY
uniref:Uncharacterized protein n=1 Tax=Megaviridae environmental sample TaxID=1737588 RepID=A0A5J6VL18_9VIRU|nr:MAG: hypothetical protein [Megaviridae environmental sample]